MTERAKRQLELARAAAGGDGAAFAKLIEDSRRFIMRQVRKAAQEWRAFDDNVIDDLYAESVLTIFAKLGTFEPERAGWLMFVYWQTRGACQLWLRRHVTTVQESYYALRVRFRLKRARQVAGEGVTDAELLEQIGATKAMRKRLSTPWQRQVSLNVVDDEGVSPVKSQVMNALVQTNTAEDAVLEKDDRVTVRRALELLEPRQRRVLVRRFGLDGREATLEEVGEEFGVTRERVRQLEVKALKQLRAVLEQEA